MSDMNRPLLAGDAESGAAFIATAGDRYARAVDPESGNELRCAINSVSGPNCEIQFYNKEKDVPQGDPITIATSAVQAMEYPDAGVCHDGSAPVAKASLLTTDAEVGLTTEEHAKRTAKFGPNMLEEKKRNKLLELLKCFWGPMPIMIWIACIVEVIEEDWPDFGVLLALQLINGILGWYEDMKAGDAIEALKASLKPQATCKRDGMWNTIKAGGLVPGDIVLLGAGASVPADCELLGGPLQIDQAALTGESLPVTMKRGQVAKMGSTITSGECEGIVYDHGPNTFFGKTASMIANVDEIGHFQKILLKITGFLMGVSTVLVTIALILLLHREGKCEQEGFRGFMNCHGQSIAFCVVLLVASIPIAMPVVSTSTMALGSRALSSEGAIVTRLASIEEVAGMDMLCSDKTGTLTKNIMELQEDIPIFTKDVTREDVLMYAAMGAKWKEPPKDALDTLVLKSFDPDDDPARPKRTNLFRVLDKYEMLDHIPFNPTDKRTESTIKGPEGYFKVTKGAPHVILDMAHNRDEIHDKVEEVVNGFAMRGVRCLSVGRTQVTPKQGGEDRWEYLGIITFLDPPREDTAETIRRAREYGVGVKMITGDQVLIAKDMAKTIGLGQNILLSDGIPDLPPDKKAPPDTGIRYGKMIEDTDGFAQVFPEHKFMIVEALKQRGWQCGMTGDGVNDAPALKVANIGIAVEGATDAAQAASDIVLTQPGLSTIVDAIILARQIFQRLRNYVIYRIACTIQLLLFFFIGVVLIEVACPSCKYMGMSPSCMTTAEKTPEPQILHGDMAHFGEPCESDPSHNCALTSTLCHKQFMLPVIAIVLITILNDGTIISIAYDTVLPSPRPEHWRLPEVFLVSTLLGAVAVRALPPRAPHRAADRF